MRSRPLPPTCQLSWWVFALVIVQGFALGWWWPW